MVKEGGGGRDSGASKMNDGFEVEQTAHSHAWGVRYVESASLEAQHGVEEVDNFGNRCKLTVQFLTPAAVAELGYQGLIAADPVAHASAVAAGFELLVKRTSRRRLYFRAAALII